MVTYKTFTGARFADSTKVFVKPTVSGDKVVRCNAVLYFSLCIMNSHNMSSETICMSCSK